MTSMDDFTPYRLDLTGLRAGQVIKHGGVLYDVECVEIRETLGGRDKHTGAPLMIETRVDLDLHRARWADEPGIEPPADVLELPDVSDPRQKPVINGQAYWIRSVSRTAAYVTGVRGSFSGVADEPEHIELQLVRNPIADPQSEYA